jgi:hypothetical protein
MGKDPPRKFEPGRLRVRRARKLALVPVALVYVPCEEGNKCKHDCAYVGAGDRPLLYQEYVKIRGAVSALTPYSFCHHPLYPSPAPYYYRYPSYHRCKKVLNTARIITCSNS